MDWTNELVIQFLEQYKALPCIWNPKHPSYKNRPKVMEAWTKLKENLGFPGTVKELKKKKESLMSMYRCYKTKIKKSELSGEEIYQPSWFAFPLMDSFLGNIYTCRITMNIEDDQIQDLSNNINDENIEIVLKSEPRGNDNYSESEQESDESDSITQVESFNKRSSAVIATKRRREGDPLEDSTLSGNRDSLNKSQAFKIMKTTSKERSEEDESDIFGRLVAKKLRRLTDERRDTMMFKIIELFHKETKQNNSISYFDD